MVSWCMGSDLRDRAVAAVEENGEVEEMEMERGAAVGDVTAVSGSVDRPSSCCSVEVVWKIIPPGGMQRSGNGVVEPWKLRDPLKWSPSPPFPL